MQFLSVIQFTTVAVAVSHLFGASYDQYSSDDVVTVAKVGVLNPAHYPYELFLTAFRFYEPAMCYSSYPYLLPNVPSYGYADVYFLSTKRHLVGCAKVLWHFQPAGV